MSNLYTKSLTILEDQMQHEYLACCKAREYAQSFTDDSLKTFANTLANAHKQRFTRLYDYLNSNG